MFYEEVGVTHQSSESIPWVPWEIADGVFLKLYKVDPVHGVMLLAMKTPGGVQLGRHRHTGFVQLYTAQGAWKYAEHDWIARAGDVVYETADSIHSFVSQPGADVIAFVVLNGTLEFLDQDDKVLWTESWRTALERQRKYCAAKGIPCPDVSSFAG
jgi:quercetin dioxygenase-like cupin family protein